MVTEGSPGLSPGWMMRSTGVSGPTGAPASVLVGRYDTVVLPGIPVAVTVSSTHRATSMVSESAMVTGASVWETVDFSPNVPSAFGTMV